MTVSFRAYKSDNYKMAALADAGESSNAVLIHEVTNLRSKITKMNRQGYVIFEKQLEARAGKDFYMYSEFTVGADGKVYVLVERGSSPLSVKEELVFVYDESMNLLDKISIASYDHAREYAFGHLDCVDDKLYVLNRYTGEIIDVETMLAIGAIYDEPIEKPIVKDFVMASKDLVYISSYRGKVWRYQEGDFQVISETFNASKHFVPNYLSVDQNGDLYLMNLYDMNLYVYKDESWQQKWDANAPINHEYVYGDFTKLTVDENGQVAAINRKAEELLFIDDGGAYVVEVKENYLNTYGLFAALMFLVVSCVFIAFDALIKRIIKQKGRLPLAFKQSLIVSGLLLVTISIVGYLVVDDVVSIMEENHYAKLNAIAYEKVSMLNLDEYRQIDVLEDYGTEAYDQLQNKYLPSISKEEASIAGVDDTLYFDTYMLEDGYLLRGINYDMMGYERLHERYEAYYDVANGAGVYNGIVQDDNGTSWMISIIPIVEEGEIIGIFEVGSDYRKFLADTESVQASFIKLAILILVIAMISIIAIINRLLNHLKTMTDAVEKIGKGDLEVRVNIRSNDELGVFASGINRMIANVKRNMNKVYAVNAAYSRFVPKSIEQLLGKDDLMHVQEGDEVLLRGYIIYIKYDDDMDEATYGQVNEIFPKLLSKTYESAGILLEQNASGIKLFYEESNVCFAMVEQYVELIKTAVGNFKILVDYSDLEYSLVGTENMLTPMYFSQANRLFGSMAYYAETLGVQFLLTERAIMTFDYSNANLRAIAKTRLDEREVMFYHYFEYDTIEAKKLKLATRSAFEHGVDLYQSKAYLEAIDYFIKVIAMDSNDKVSKILLGQCQDKLSS